MLGPRAPEVLGKRRERGVVHDAVDFFDSSSTMYSNEASSELSDFGTLCVSRSCSEMMALRTAREWRWRGHMPLAERT